LFDAKAVLAAKTQNRLIGFEALQLPRIDDTLDDRSTTCRCEGRSSAVR
jgi:hypothetical protein